MKKLLFLGVAVLAMAFVSCETKTADNAEATDSTKVEATDSTVAAPAADVPALADILEKAKAEGANWTADQWKENLTAALNAYKPFAVEYAELFKDPTKLDENAIKNLEDKYGKDFPELIQQFVDLAEKSDNGKDLVTDEALKKTMEEMQIPELK